MLNWLWGFMIIIGIVYALITGNIESVTQGHLFPPRKLSHYV